jgi:hypothetical protein
MVPSLKRISTILTHRDCVWQSGGGEEPEGQAGLPGRGRGRSHGAAKIAITAVMQKLVVTANALLKADRCWQQSFA